jgi:hypothetical protein
MPKSSNPEDRAARAAVDPHGEMEAALAKLAKWVGALVADATTVEVQTIVGDPAAGGLKGKWQDGRFVPDLDASLVVRGLTRIRFDGDTAQIVPTRPDGSIDEPLYNVHKETVKAAHDYRASLLAAIGPMLGGLFGQLKPKR